MAEMGLLANAGPEPAVIDEELCRRRAPRLEAMVSTALCLNSSWRPIHGVATSL